MNKIENKILDWAERNMTLLFAVVISIIALLVRYFGLDWHSGDYDGFLLPWYNTIKESGGFSGLSEQVGNYNVLYQICIAVMTYLPIHPLTAYKGFSVLFDYLLALCAGYIVYSLTDRDKVKAVISYGMILMIPSIFFNSAYWAQCDAIYSYFLLAGILCLMKKKEFIAFICFAVAFQFKLQAIFIVPFLFVYYVISRRFTIGYFFLIPLLGVPLCLICGRLPFDSLQIYLEQTGQHNGMTLSFPNVWNLVSDRYEIYGRAATLITIAALGIGFLLILRCKPTFNQHIILDLAIWSVWTCVMFLPNMHERYAYFLNVLMLITAVINSKRIGYAVLLELLTLIMYAKCFFRGSTAYNVPMYVCSAAYITAYSLFFMKHFSIKNKTE